MDWSWDKTHLSSKKFIYRCVLTLYLNSSLSTILSVCCCPLLVLFLFLFLMENKNNKKKKVFCVASNEYALRIKIPENGTSIPCGFNGMWPMQLVDHYPPMRVLARFAPHPPCPKQTIKTSQLLLWDSPSISFSYKWLPLIHIFSR